MRIHDYPCPRCKGRHLWRHKLCTLCGGTGFVLPSENPDEGIDAAMLRLAQKMERDIIKGLTKNEGK